MEKVINNQVVICGELIDFVNVKKGETKTGNEYFKYDMVIETNKETCEQHQVTFFEMRDGFNGKENGRWKAMYTAYDEVEGYKSRVTHGKGEIVRVTGRLAIESYVSKNENKIVDKIVVKGQYFSRLKEGEKEKEPGYFDSCATFKGTMFVDKMEETEDKLIIKGLVNEYKSKNKILGHLVEFVCDNKESIEGMKSLVKETDVANIGCVLQDIVETRFLPEEETKELPLKEVKGFGTAVEDAKRENEKIKKENARRKELRENGIQVHRTGLIVTGSAGAYTQEEIEEKELPFDKDSINDMFDDIYYKQDMLNAQLGDLNSSDEVPF